MIAGSPLLAMTVLFLLTIVTFLFWPGPESEAMQVVIDEYNATRGTQDGVEVEMLLFSRQGKLRLQKWYAAHPDKTKKKIVRELVTLVLSRKPKMCSFLEWKDFKIVYKRY